MTIKRSGIGVAAEQHHAVAFLRDYGLHRQRTRNGRNVVDVYRQRGLGGGNRNDAVLVEDADRDGVDTILQVLMRDIEVRCPGGELELPSCGAVAPVDVQGKRIQYAGIGDPAGHPG